MEPYQRYDGKINASIQRQTKIRNLIFAADLGHYIADAHMPLHTSDNHDGQLTDQRNSLFVESRLPNYSSKTINLQLLLHTYYGGVNKATWDMIMVPIA
jgi:hypothetical protein